MGLAVGEFCTELTKRGTSGKAKSDKVADEAQDDLEAWKKSSATKTAKFVDALQNRLPLARIVYLSATGASDPKHFCNLHRLGLWGQVLLASRSLLCNISLAVIYRFVFVSLSSAGLTSYSSLGHGFS